MKKKKSAFQQLKLFDLVIDDKKHKRFLIENGNSKKLVYYDDKGYITKLVGFGLHGMKTIHNIDAKSYVKELAGYHNRVTNVVPVNNMLPVLHTNSQECYKYNVFYKDGSIKDFVAFANNMKKQGLQIKRVDGGCYVYGDLIY